VEKQLIFFNKEGDALNTTWNQTTEKWEADLIFHENSSDTFKTIGLYTFEKVGAFDYLSDKLILEKWQLFNERGFNFYTSDGLEHKVDKIEPTNKDINFFSKWIYGENFDNIFKEGTLLRFQNPIFEFTDINKTYEVIDTKKGACLIVSDLSNATFSVVYSPTYSISSTYNDIFVSSVNSIAILDYLNQDLTNKLSSWSEPNFYNKLFVDRKLNVINSNSNDGLFTIENKSLNDLEFYNYYIDEDSLQSGEKLIVSVELLTSNPFIYEGALNISATMSRINFSSDIPGILKPGSEFIIPESTLNNDRIIVGDIEQFSQIQTTKFVSVDDLVIYNNKIYQCILGHTYSMFNPILPIDQLYWVDTPNYLPIETTLTSEVLPDATIQLTNNVFVFEQEGELDNKSTIYKFAEKFSQEFRDLKISLSFDGNRLSSNLNFSSKWANIRYFAINSSNNITNLEIKRAKNIEVAEPLISEKNSNISQRFNYLIQFTDIDDFGIKIIINGEEYYQDVVFIFNGPNVDMVRTIDKTLRDWIGKWFTQLTRLGIIPSLEWVGGSSIYFNSISLSTQYPNVPINFEIFVGVSAEYFIYHSDVSISEIGANLDILINGISYQEPSVLVSAPTYSVSSTLDNWLDTWSVYLVGFDIFVTKINQNTLSFKTKKQRSITSLDLKIGLNDSPGQKRWNIIEKSSGNIGTIITSNSLGLTPGPTQSFTEAGFSTGMLVSIINTIFPFNNQEYNIIYLNDNIINLSYQGPFWGSDSVCDGTSSVIFEYPDGSTFSICSPGSGFIGSGAEFNLSQYDDSFSIEITGDNQYFLSTSPTINNPVDLIYIQLSEKVFILGDTLESWDAVNKTKIKNISLPGNLNPVTLKWNSFNNYLYVLSENFIYKIDPIIDEIISTIPITDTPNQMEVNPSNGDIYVTYITDNRISIFSATDSLISDLTIIGTGYKIAKSFLDSNIYIPTSNNQVLEIENNTRIISTTYSIAGVGSEIIYNWSNGDMLTNASNLIRINSGSFSSTTINGGSDVRIIFNASTNNILIARDDNTIELFDSNYNILFSKSIGNFGEVSTNSFDSDFYMASGSQILVIDSTTGNIKFNESIPGGNITKSINNPKRRSIWFLQPGSNRLIEIEVSILNAVTISDNQFLKIIENQLGTLSSSYNPLTTLWFKTREFLRKPRENFDYENKKVNFIWKLEGTNDEIFLFDFSGSQLPTTGAYAYTGPRPLTNISLNRNSNKHLEKVNIPEYQQTIFEEIYYELDWINSSQNVSFLPEPMETFIGFNSSVEGTISNKLKLIKRENVIFEVLPDNINSNFIDFNLESDDNVTIYGKIILHTNSSVLFTTDELDNNRGFKPEQEIEIFLTDITNNRNQFISFNNGIRVKIREIYSREIIVDFVGSQIFSPESNIIVGYPRIGQTTYMKTTIKVVDKEIASFNIKGQTEIEDIRFKTELSNTGKEINSETAWIFKEYDINEQGVDWNFLNKKRKELLLVRNQIFPYIGSYKAIINAINYFGYNDLSLYEYFRNINVNSPDFEKLSKIEVPDIFNNSKKGFDKQEFFSFPNPNYEETKLFNLSYRITDKKGNSLLTYSLKEVIIKLDGLKDWLEKNIIPITHNILDITGLTDFHTNTSIQHKSYDVTLLQTNESFAPVDFKVNEGYLIPINSSSVVYNILVEFESKEIPEYFSVEVRTFNTYKEWEPFKTYDLGDRISYIGRLFESTKINNRINNPYEYDKVSEWSNSINYEPGQLSNYKKETYIFSGTQSVFDYGDSETPLSDIKWTNISHWKEISLSPVQTIKEFKTNLSSFNFTIDLNIDPYIQIKCISDNGRGLTYTKVRNYEIRWIEDISNPTLTLVEEPLPNRL
jgi:hypothetical protein